MNLDKDDNTPLKLSSTNMIIKLQRLCKRNLKTYTTYLLQKWLKTTYINLNNPLYVFREKYGETIRP